MDNWVSLYLVLSYIGTLVVFIGIGWSIRHSRHAFYKVYKQPTQQRVRVNVRKCAAANQETHAGSS